MDSPELQRSARRPLQEASGHVLGDVAMLLSCGSRGESRIIILAVVNQTVAWGTFWKSHPVFVMLSVTCVGLGAPLGRYWELKHMGRIFPARSHFSSSLILNLSLPFWSCIVYQAACYFYWRLRRSAQLTDEKDTLSSAHVSAETKPFSAFARLSGWLWQWSVWAVLVILQLQCRWNSNCFTFFLSGYTAVCYWVTCETLPVGVFFWVKRIHQLV